MKRFLRKVKNFLLGRKNYEQSPNMKIAINNLKSANSVVDLGCGSSPCSYATVAVDKYIEPIHRQYGANKKIEVEKIEERGIKFVCADFEELPFKDNEFDMAYSHHVIEHIEHPENACREMQRIAKRGVIMCPSIFAEGMFGRKYHKWKITSVGTRLIFIEKSIDEKDVLWFGEGPQRINGKVQVPKKCNPFDILLNESRWYYGFERFPRLTKLIRKYWFGHYEIMENVFNWEDSFQYTIFYANGKVINSENT